MTGPTLSLAEAARRSGRSTTTLRRWIDDGRLQGVERLTGGGYAIPVASMIAAGLEPRTTPADTPSSNHLLPAPSAETEALRAELDALRGAELARLRSEVDDLRERLDRRDAEVADLIGAIERMSRALPAGTPPADTPPAPVKRLYSSGPTSTLASMTGSLRRRWNRGGPA